MRAPPKRVSVTVCALCTLCTVHPLGVLQCVPRSLSAPETLIFCACTQYLVPRPADAAALQVAATKMGRHGKPLATTAADQKPHPCISASRLPAGHWSIGGSILQTLHLQKSAPSPAFQPDPTSANPTSSSLLFHLSFFFFPFVYSPSFNFKRLDNVGLMHFDLAV